MFWRKKEASSLSIACTLSDTSYSIAIVKNNKQVVFNKAQFFNDSKIDTITKALAKDVDRLNILAQDCQLILTPDQYQLILMDALNVPEAEMAKALRWNLKGLSDYDLDDVAIDTCLVPYHDGESERKAFVAITPQTALNQKRALLESVFLNVSAVTIVEIALRNLLPLMWLREPAWQDVPIIIISICNDVRKLHIVYKGLYYLIRELSHGHTSHTEEPKETLNLTYEIERSIDYCVNQLSLPEPKHIFFTPGFYNVVNALQPIGEHLGLSVEVLDLAHYLEISPALSLKEQHEVFYCIAGALTMPLEVVP